jgi:8-oxo-dGTP diphosphatase
MTIGHFLGGVGGLIWDPKSGKYLLLRRSVERDFQAGAWECVTGRVDQGESFEQALHREIREEVSAEVKIEFIIATTHFFRGAPSAENELLGLIFSCILDDPGHINIDSEHSEYRWATVKEIDAMLPDENWLKRAIHRAEVQTPVQWMKREHLTLGRSTKPQL